MPGSINPFSRSSSCCIARRSGSLTSEADSAKAVFVTAMGLINAAKQIAVETKRIICNFLWTKCILLASLSTGRLAWWREDGWTCRALRLTLRFDLADEHGGRDGANRNAAGFRAADAVEDVLFVV